MVSLRVVRDCHLTPVAVAVAVQLDVWRKGNYVFNALPTATTSFRRLATVPASERQKAPGTACTALLVPMVCTFTVSVVLVISFLIERMVTVALGGPGPPGLMLRPS
jgi:hypothetical protein